MFWGPQTVCEQQGICARIPTDFQKLPNASERIQTHSDASERIRAGPNGSEQVQACSNTLKKLQRLANFQVKTKNRAMG